MQPNFISIDFETATCDKMACQLGITIVEDGEIKDTIVRLIQPPQNKYDWGCINVHHITPENTLNSPTFDVVWEEIKQLFSQNTIVAHNAAFDEAVLRANLDYYGIDHNSIAPFLCTYKIYGLSLDKLCYLFDIPLDNHHDAGFDACCCAKFYLNHLNGVEVDCSKLQSMPTKDCNTYHTRLSGNILQKDLSGADPSNPFYNKKVVITGVFDIDRKDLAAKLKSLGADIDTGITKCTSYVFVGKDAGPSKIAKIKSLTEAGYSIVTLGQDDAKSVMENNLSLIQPQNNTTMETPILFSSPINNIQDNPFYGRRIAYTGSFTIDASALSKKLKEWGADVNNSITKATNIVLIGENPNAEKLNQLESRIHDGFHIKKLYQEDIDKIFSGINWEDYNTSAEVVKSLDFTIEHFNLHHYQFNEGAKNKIARKELYFCEGFRKDKYAIQQITGNLAAWSNSILSPQIQIFVLSNATIEKLARGEKDENILMIENYYNKNKGDKFDFSFMQEQDILDFAQLWCNTHGDKVLLALYERYMNSEY